MKENIKSMAKDLAWKSLSKNERKLFMKQAKEKHDKKMQDLAIKCMKEAEEAMSKPGYISRADPASYGDE